MSQTQAMQPNFVLMKPLGETGVEFVEIQLLNPCLQRGDLSPI
jgi:hypothetical protein